MFNILYFNHFSFHHSVNKIECYGKNKACCHSLYELLFIAKGNNEFLIENKTYKVKDNSLFIIPPGMYHTMLYDPGENYERCIMYFDQNLIPPCITIENCINTTISEDIISLFWKFDSYADQYKSDALYYLLLSFLHELLIRIVYSGKDSLETSNLPPIVKQAISYINRNLDQPLKLETIAQELFVSKSHLCHLFQANTQISVMDYIKIKKMHRAQNLLSRGFSPTQVSKLLNYDTYSTFLRNYKSIFHCNPSINEISEKSKLDFFKE